jgi:hypothetical protein
VLLSFADASMEEIVVLIFYQQKTTKSWFSKSFRCEKVTRGGNILIQGNKNL